MFYHFSIIAFFSVFAAPVFSQYDPQYQDQLTGTWKGTSACQLRGSPCRDEIVAYHISRLKQTDSFEIVMNKLVNGAEEQMIALHFAYDPVRKTLSTIYRLTSFWEFTWDGDMMYGTLIFDRELYRIIKLKKEK